MLSSHTWPPVRMLSWNTGLLYPMTSSLLAEILDNTNPHSSATLWTGMVRPAGLTEASYTTEARMSPLTISSDMSQIVSHLLRSVVMYEYWYAWIWVWKWGTHKFLGILSMLRVSEVWKNKLYSSFTQVSWVLCPRSWIEFEYHESLYSNSSHHKKFLYSTQVLK